MAHGFVDARIALFKKEFPRAYAYVTDAGVPRSAAHLRAAIQRTAAYVWAALPIDCPETPLACSWGIEEIENPPQGPCTVRMRTIQDGINKQFEVTCE